MTLKKWQLLSSTDVSPSKWFPVEKRKYKHPNGQIIDDFTVTTLADVSMIVPITKDGKIVIVRQFKPGADEFTLEFPAGRREKDHTSFLATAHHELEEETGIDAPMDSFIELGKLSGFTTKASELVYVYLVTGCEFNSVQNLDPNEEIEVLTFSRQEIEDKITSNEIWFSQTIASWELAKRKHPEIITQ